MRAIDRHETAIVAVYDECEAGESYSLVLNRVAREHGLAPERLDSMLRVWCGIAGLSPMFCRGHDIIVDDCPMAWSPSVDAQHAARMMAIYRDINPDATVTVKWAWWTP